MSIVRVSATLAADPPSTGDSSFPSSSTTIPFGLTGGINGKQAAAQTGAQSRLIASPSAFVELDGVGVNNTVPKGDTHYLRTSVVMSVRLTFLDLSTAVIPVKGVLLIEYDPANPLTLLEVKGSGQVEWFVSGPSS
jgi:hypothetical protein